MNSDISVSVVIPCFNAEEFLERAVKSVFIQNIQNFEIILVNNNSKDNTQLVINRLIEKHPDIIKTIIELKAGAPYARNSGLALAKGKYIQFLDADDELLEGKLESQLNLIENKNAHVVLGSFYKINNNNRIFFKVNSYDNLWKSFVASKLGITSANLYLKSKLIDVKGWTEQLSSSQEYELLFKIIKMNGVVVLDEVPRTIIYEPDNSITRTPNAEKTIKLVDDYVSLRENVKEFLRKRNELTSELNIFIDKCIYRTLKGREKYNKLYVNKKIESLNLLVPNYYKQLVWLKNVIK